MYVGEGSRKTYLGLDVGDGWSLAHLLSDMAGCQGVCEVTRRSVSISRVTVAGVVLSAV